MQKKKILENTQILNKIKRISLQIIESNLDSNKIIICGIEKNGALLAKKICKELDLISEKNIIFCSMKINKLNPTENIQLSIDINECKNQSVVIVDDVLNSGKTLTYAVKHFLDIEIESIKTAVLVNRSHKKFPISADFKGINLSSSLQNHVDVVFMKDKIEAFLF
tara:strand:+ start:711 stop:1208 length:498 start_codon:yes stop_codon:yes gene_type:complete